MRDSNDDNKGWSDDSKRNDGNDGYDTALDQAGIFVTSKCGICYAMPVCKLDLVLNNYAFVDSHVHIFKFYKITCNLNSLFLFVN